MTRSPEDVFGHHATALAAGDLDALVADHAEADGARAVDGVETIVSGPDCTRAQTVRYTLERT